MIVTTLQAVSEPVILDPLQLINDNILPYIAGRRKIRGRTAQDFRKVQNGKSFPMKA